MEAGGIVCTIRVCGKACQFALIETAQVSTVSMSHLVLSRVSSVRFGWVSAMRDARIAKPGRSAFDKAADLLALVASIGLTFVCGPLLFRAWLQVVLDYASEQIFAGWDWLFTALWAVGCAIGTFALFQMVLAITLRLGMAKLGAIIFRH